MKPEIGSNSAGITPRDRSGTWEFTGGLASPHNVFPILGARQEIEPCNKGPMPALFLAGTRLVAAGWARGSQLVINVCFAFPVHRGRQPWRGAKERQESEKESTGRGRAS